MRIRVKIKFSKIMMIVGYIDRKYSVFVIESNCGDQLFFKDSERLTAEIFSIFHSSRCEKVMMETMRIILHRIF